MKSNALKMTGTQLLTLLLLTVLTLNLSCDTEDQNNSPCNTTGGPEITNQIGRIYKWTNSDPQYYYIGNEQPVTSGINGGYIPCNDLPSEFKKEGLIIKYSGIDKGSFPDTADPLWAYVDIKSIEKVN
jgi:hypothetical protein